MTELKQALICLNKRASATSTRNLLQECIWTARITGRKIIKYLPITFEFLLYKSIYSKQPNLKSLPEKFANKYIRLWYIICYRKDILCDYLLNNMNTPEINKMVTHIVFLYNSKAQGYILCYFAPYRTRLNAALSTSHRSSIISGYPWNIRAQV